MADAATHDEETRDALRRHIIDGLNKGLSLPAAIRAAIDAGFDEILAQQVGRELRDDIARMKKRQALKAARNGVLWMVCAIAAGVVARFTPLASYGSLVVWVADLALFVAFVTGLVKVIRGLVAYATNDSRIR